MTPTSRSATREPRKRSRVVYNPGERVEGYTDFLWTLIAALVILFKADPGQVSVLINLASYVALLFLMERLGRRLKACPY